MIEIDEKNIIGKTIVDIYETKATTKPGFFDTVASYFQIVMELDNGLKYEITPHQILLWDKEIKLIRTEGTSWSKENGLIFKMQKIIKVIKHDCDEYYDGSLSLVLSNNITIANLSTNGNELYIDTYHEEG